MEKSEQNKLSLLLYQEKLQFVVDAEVGKIMIWANLMADSKLLSRCCPEYWEMVWASNLRQVLHCFYNPAIF